MRRGRVSRANRRPAPMTRASATTLATPLELRDLRTATDAELAAVLHPAYADAAGAAARRVVGLPGPAVPVRRGVRCPALAAARHRRATWTCGRLDRRATSSSRISATRGGTRSTVARRTCRSAGSRRRASRSRGTSSRRHPGRSWSVTCAAGSRSTTGSSAGARVRSPPSRTSSTCHSTGAVRIRSCRLQGMRRPVTPACSGSCRAAGVRARPGCPDSVPSPTGDIALWLHVIAVPDGPAELARLRLQPIAPIDGGGAVVVAAITAFRGIASPLAIEPRRTLRIDDAADAPMSVDLGQIFRAASATPPLVVDRRPAGVVVGVGDAARRSRGSVIDAGRPGHDAGRDAGHR